MSSELEAARLASEREIVEVFDLTRELDIGGFVRLEMIAEPDRAVAVLRHAMKAPKIRNRAGFAVSNWKTGFDPRPAGDLVEEELAEAGPPALADLEHAWSLQPSPVADALLRAMAAALTAAGGFKQLQREFRRVADDRTPSVQRDTGQCCVGCTWGW